MRNFFFANVQLFFELKVIFIFFFIGFLCTPQKNQGLSTLIIPLLLGLACGVLMEGVIVLAQYFNLFPDGFSFLGVDLGSYSESLGGMRVNRVGGTFGHPNFLCLPMAGVLLPLAVSALLSSDKLRLFFTASLSAALLALVLTLSRAGWLGAFFSAVFFLIIGLFTHGRHGFSKAS